jgi:hypothetical protein
MSERIFLNSIPSSSKVDGEIIYHLNDFDSQNKSIINNKNHYLHSFFTTKILNENIRKDKEIKIGLNIFNSIVPKQEEETTSIIKEQNANINSSLNLESNQGNHNFNIKFKINLLESKKDCSNIIGDSSKNSEYENNFYLTIIHFNNTIFNKLSKIYCLQKHKISYNGRKYDYE